MGHPHTLTETETVKVRFRTICRGPELSADPGDEREVPDELGEALLEAGSVELLEGERKARPKRETAEANKKTARTAEQP